MKTRAYRLIAVILFALLSLELGATWLGFGDPPLAMRDDELEYRLVPSASYQRWGNRVEINSHGFRSDDVPAVIQSGELRILLIGDSVAYGNHFLDQEQTIAVQLSKALSTPECPVRVIPMAVSSWGPVNQEAALRRYGTFGAAEVAIVLSAHDSTDIPEPGGSLVPYRLSQPRSAIGDVLEAVIERLFPPKSSVQLVPYEERLQMSFGALASIRQSVLATGANLLLVYNATVPERISGIEKDGQRIIDWANQNGVPSLDLSRVPGITYSDSIHPDPEGAFVIARELARYYTGRLTCWFANTD